MFVALLSPSALRTAATDVWAKRELLWTLTVRDLRSRQLGSYLGFVWTFVQPLLTLVVLWFVFDIGFKAKPANNAAFIVWLACGLIPWQYFSDTLNSASSSIVDSGYLIKKVVFRSTILPLVKALSSTVVHVFFIGFLIVIALAKGTIPGPEAIQILYYSLAAGLLALGISWTTAAVSPFVPDATQVVLIVLQFGFWLTPVFWSKNILPAAYLPFFKLNPMYYVVEGYREALIDKVWFWTHPALTIYFWSFCLTVWAIGAVVFRRLRPHFADVL